MPFVDAMSLKRPTNCECERVPQILLITDDVELRARLGLLEHSGYDVTHCRDSGALQLQADRCAAAPGAWDFDLLICEARLLDEATLKVLRQFRPRRQPPLVLLRQSKDQAIATLAAGLRAVAVCAKFDIGSQLELVRQLAPVARPPERPLPDRK